MASPLIPDSIRARLAGLRARLRLWQGLAGLARLLALACLLMLLSLLVDRTWRMDFSQRLLSLVLGGLGLGFVAWRYLWQPLRHAISDDRLVLAVERRYPALASRLISALQFSLRDPSVDGASPALVQSTISQGATAAGELDFTGVLDWRRFRQHALVAGAALLVPLILALSQPRLMGLWFQRNILLASVEWPRQTRLSIHDLVEGQLRVPSGGDLRVLVSAAGVAPEEVILTMEDANGERRQEQMPLGGDGHYFAVFPNVQQAFRLRVAGGDDRTDWVPVLLLPRPTVTTLRVTATLPAYLAAEPRILPARRQAYEVLAGSALSLAVASDLPLAKLQVTRGTETLASITPAGQEGELSLAAGQLVSGTLLLHLTSTEGVTGLRPTPVELRVVDDQVPKVKAGPRGIGQLVLAKARVPMTVEATDDYGVTEMAVAYGYQAPASEQPGDGRVPLPELQRDATGTWRAAPVIELGPWNLPPETTLTLRAQARDAKPGDDRLGVSVSSTLRVVTEEELRADFQRREQGLRVYFETALAQQRVLLDESRLFASPSTRLAPEVAASRQLLLEKNQHRQIRVSDRLLSDYTQLRDELVNNRLENEPSPTRERYEAGIMAPVTALRDELLPAAVAAISRARATRGEGRGAAWSQAAVAQERVIDAMLAIRKKLAQSEDVQKAIRLLQQMVEQQRQLQRETAKQSAREIEGLFDDK